MREKAKKHFRIPLNRANKIALNFTGGSIGVGFKLIGMPLNALTNTPKRIAI